MSYPIQIENLKFSYDTKVILDIPSLNIEPKSKTMLYGHSGSGKSTLLNLLCGILQPQAGQIFIDDTPLHQLSHQQRDAYRAKHLGVIFQQFNLIPYLSVLENIQLANYFALNRHRPASDRLESMLQHLGLTQHQLHQRVDALSIGQQQRVAIARAFIHQPQLIIADEPTSALDNHQRDQFIELLLQIAAENNSTVILVSHDTNLKQHFSSHIDLHQVNQAQATAGDLS
jgi:putative ABC transport system ATP-binding protein